MTDRRDKMPPEWIERGPGDGARSQENDTYRATEYAHKDKRAPTDTTFWPSDIEKLDIPGHRKQQLRRMHERQEGQHVNSDTEDSRGQQNHNEWKRRRTNTFTAHLEMTDYQKSRVMHLVIDVLDINSFGHYSVEEVILATITKVAREDMRRSGQHMEDRKDFQSLCDEVGTEVSRIRRVRKLVKNRLRG